MSLITIDQLLESVDLDFEPRWVAKSHGGCITISDVKPVQRKNGIWWFDDYAYNTISIRHIKLSEFDGKDWTECIYEVPRKTTEKIKEIILTPATTKNTDMFIVNKINELVDAVNKHADIIQQIGEWGTRKGECLWCENLTKFDPEGLKGAKNE